MAASDLERLLAAVAERAPGPEIVSYFGPEPGYSPSREFQDPRVCQTCGGDDRYFEVVPGRTPYDAPRSLGTPDPITHGELVTWVCEGCGRTRSRANFGGIHAPDKKLLADYAGTTYGPVEEPTVCVPDHSTLGGTDPSGLTNLEWDRRRRALLKQPQSPVGSKKTDRP